MTAALKSRAEAMAKGDKRYFTGKTCPHGHIAERYCSSNACIECLREHSARYYAADPEHYRQSHRKWEAKNKEYVRALHRSYRERNLEKCKAAAIRTAKRHYEKNKASVLAYIAQWQRENKEARTLARKKWTDANPDWARARVAKRRAQLAKAIPPWADLARIREIYAEADRLTKDTGVKYHVDHEVPLVHKQVCGLHVEFNLRVIPVAENHRKSNKFAP